MCSAHVQAAVVSRCVVCISVYCYKWSRCLHVFVYVQVVQVFSNTGECRLRFGSAGRVAGKIQRPTGVAVTLNGNYLVADYDNKWVSIFAPDGKYLSKVSALWAGLFTLGREKSESEGGG